jgi:L-iditol 2-dehydrogenase
MKAALLENIKKFKIANIPKPVIENPDDVLVRVKRAGVCGSDIHYYLNGCIGSQVVEFPFIIGHECSGTVAETGKNVKNLQPDQKVVIEPAVSCHKCYQCRLGRENTCENLQFLGLPGQMQGCLCEYMVLPAENCLPIENKLSLEQGVLCEPFTIGVYAVKQSNPKPDSKIAVLGSGPIGLSCIAAARAQGISRIYATDLLDYRTAAARKGGAGWAGNPEKQNVVEEIRKRQPNGIDIAFECAGKQETIDQAIEILRPGGTLMLIGIPEEDRVSFIVDRMRRKEIAVINVRRQNKCTRSAMEMVASKKADIDFMVTHNFNIDQVQEAFEMVANYEDNVIKAIIEI